VARAHAKQEPRYGAIAAGAFVALLLTLAIPVLWMSYDGGAPPLPHCGSRRSVPAQAALTSTAVGLKGAHHPPVNMGRIPDLDRAFLNQHGAGNDHDVADLNHFPRIMI